MKACACGIAAVDCEYHRPDPESEMLTLQSFYLFGIEREQGETDDALRARVRAKIEELCPPTIRPPWL